MCRKQHLVGWVIEPTKPRKHAIGGDQDTNPSRLQQSCPPHQNQVWVPKVFDEMLRYYCVARPGGDRWATRITSEQVGRTIIDEAPIEEPEITIRRHPQSRISRTRVRQSARSCTELQYAPR